VCNRSAQAGFNKEDLFPTKIALPTLSYQAEIAEILDDVERVMLANRDEREQMVELKSALLDDLLSGRVRVPA
jgi:restriction endonuclease S subunit